jgi:hypothetical protein
VAGAGDIDDDGTPDLIVGASEHSFSSATRWALGLAEVRSGQTGQTIWRVVGVNSEQHTLSTGRGVGPAGDVDADGVDDYLYYSDGYSSASFTVCSGATSKVLFTKLGKWPNSVGLGHSLLGAVDLNGDGHADVVAADSWGTASGTGFVRAYNGKTAKALYTVGAPPGVCRFGSSLDQIGDVDGDGRPDLIVGGIESFPCGPGVGVVLSGATGSVLYSVSGTGRFGTSVAGVGDIDFDTYGDFVIGAYWAESSQGRAYVYSGFDGSLIQELYGSHVDGGFGGAVAGPGDVNGDGVPDIMVSASLDDERAPRSGRVSIFSGADGNVLRSFYGNGNGDTFGSSIDGAGDIDGGGLPDVILGASQWGSGGEGRASVYASERVPGTYCTNLTSSLGCEPTIWSRGTPALTGGTFRLNAQAVHNEHNGLLFWGLQSASAPFLGGVRCVSQVQARLPSNSAGNSTALFGVTDCSGTLRNDFKSPYMNSVGLTAGQTVYAQYWFPDAGAAQGAGLTDALQFTVLP